MKKFLLFVSTVILSLLLVNNKVFAQEFPELLIKAPFNDYDYVSTHQYTYEYTVEYLFVDIMITWELEEYDYHFIYKGSLRFDKGYDNRFNTYEIIDKETFVDYYHQYTLITLRVTIDKREIDDYYGDYYDYYDVLPFFSDDTALYIKFYSTDPFDAYHRGYTDGYEIGYSDGYDDGLQVGEDAGYQAGYNEGYTDGLEASDAYERGHRHGYTEGYMAGWFDGLDQADPMAYERGYNYGYDDGLKAATSKFQSNLHVWIVPAIIIVVIAGIFVGYRRERYHD